VPKNAKGEGTYTAKHIIVATGARPRALPGIEPDGKLIWTYFEAMKPAEDAEIAAGHGLRRHRHRVRLVLPDDGRRRDVVEVMPPSCRSRTPRLPPSPASSSRSRA
jgi:glycine/D-amino acid oxidase-like deaminating enzyme